MSVPDDPTVRELALVQRQIEERQREMVENQRGIANALQDTAKTLAGVMERIEAIEERADDRSKSQNELSLRVEDLRATVDKALIGTPDKPGLFTRIDRIEQSSLRNQRISNFIFGGGLLAAVATVALLWRLVQNTPHTP